MLRTPQETASFSNLPRGRREELINPKLAFHLGYQMMFTVSAIFLLHLILSFAVGSLWVTLITVIAEKKGSVLGGILGGLPSTSAFSFFFIGINQSTAAAVEATTVFPLAFGVTSAYLFLYAFFASKSFSRGIGFSLLIWFAVSGLIVASGLKDFGVCLGVGAVVSVLTYYGFAKVLRLQNLKGQETRYKLWEIVFRGVGAGALVMVAVLLSQVGGPVLGGIAAAFPAVFTSTLIILQRSRGTEFSRAVTKPLVLSGILTIIPFCVAVRYLYPALGVLFGTLVSYVLVVPLAVLSYYLAQR
ncbi:MAG: hypothetical protein ABSG33_10020 [Candidatus Bathyarchaeia archaeon]